MAYHPGMTHVTVIEAAARLDLSRRRVRDLLAQGRIRGARLTATLRGPVWSIPVDRSTGRPVVLPPPTQRGLTV